MSEPANYHENTTLIGTDDVVKRFSDAKVVGDPDWWVLICKFSSASLGLTKSTKAAQLPNGVLVQTETILGGSVSQALAFVPSISIDDLRHTPLPLSPIPTHRTPAELAETAYMAYGSTTDFMNFRGEPMPNFCDLPEKIKKAWEAAACSIAR